MHQRARFGDHIVVADAKRDVALHHILTTRSCRTPRTTRPPGYGAPGYEEGAAAQQEIGELYARVIERLRMTLSQDDSIPLSRDEGTKSSRRNVKGAA